MISKLFLVEVTRLVRSVSDGLAIVTEGQSRHYETKYPVEVPQGILSRKPRDSRVVR